MANIRKLEKELWEASDLLRAESKLTSQEYCMPVLGLIFLRYAYSRFKFVEADILANRPVRNGRVLPVEPDDFRQKSAIYLPEEARYDYILNLKDEENVGKALNKAMELIETQSPQLKGVLPNTYTNLQDDLLRELLRIFNNSAFNEIKDDIIGRIYEYFLNKFSPAVASDDGVFFTPKSLVRMIVNIIEPSHGTVLDPACGSGGMFVSSADFIEEYGANANTAMTFYGQEKVEYNAKLCIMNMAVHGLNSNIVSGDEANSFYHDAHNLDGCCDYVMANPPFNVDKVKAETCASAGRLPFGLPAVNNKKEVSNANYLWISYFYSYLNETGRAGFVMPASATDSSGRDRNIRESLLKTGHVDAIMSVGNNFFYTKSLPCSLWFFDKGKKEEIKDKVLFIDARNYYTVVDKTLNEWSKWQMKNLNAIVWLYRGESKKYQALLEEYNNAIKTNLEYIADMYENVFNDNDPVYSGVNKAAKAFVEKVRCANILADYYDIHPFVDNVYFEWKKAVNAIVDDATIFERINLYLSAKKKGYKNIRAFKKEMLNQIEYGESLIKKILTIIDEAKWLTEKFGEGVYADIAGLCKIATIDEIAEKNYSFNPGAYVGAAEVEDDGVDFEARMKEIHQELLSLQAESNELMNTISQNIKEMGL